MTKTRRWLHAFLFPREQEAIDRAADAMTAIKDAYEYQIRHDPKIPAWHYPMAGVQIGHLKTAADVWALLRPLCFAPPEFWGRADVACVTDDSWAPCPSCGAPRCLLKGTQFPERWMCRVCGKVPC